MHGGGGRGQRQRVGRVQGLRTARVVATVGVRSLQALVQVLQRGEEQGLVHGCARGALGVLQEQFPADLVESGAGGRCPVEAAVLAARPPVVVVVVASEETGCARVGRLHVLLPRVHTGQAQVAVGTGDGGGECVGVTLVAATAILGALWGWWLLQSQCLVCEWGEREGKGGLIDCHW